jgi:Mg-chelatase subunit ChlD
MHTCLREIQTRCSLCVSCRLSDEEISRFESLSIKDKISVAKGAKKDAIRRVIKKVNKAKNADIVFMVDSTGSMTRYIQMVKDNIIKLVEYLTKPRGSKGQSYISKVRVAFIGYRDVHVGEEPPSIMDFTEDIPSFRTFLSKVKATGGGDACEDVFGGLEEIQRLRWSENAGTRVLFHIADAPAMAVPTMI